MLHHLDVQNTKMGANLLTLTLSDPSNGYVVQGIEGLDPVKATLVSSGFANLDGATYQTSRREPRDIKINLGLRSRTIPVEVLRSQLYTQFMPKSEVSINFYQTDGTCVNIKGVVETCEAPPFSKEPSMVVSIVCFDPDFVGPINGTVSAALVATETQTSNTFNYAGTVPTGITFNLTATKYVSNLALCLAPAGMPESQLAFNTPLFIGDSLIVTTTRGLRSALIKKSGTSIFIPALSGVPSGAPWLEIQPGINTFRAWSAPAGIGVPYVMSWQARFGGL